jgi:hypothetical protein
MVNNETMSRKFPKNICIYNLNLLSFSDDVKSQLSLILLRLQVKLILYDISIVLIGNFLIIILFSQHRQNSCVIYIIVVTALNLFITLNIYNTSHEDLSKYSLIFCKLRYDLPD